MVSYAPIGYDTEISLRADYRQIRDEFQPSFAELQISQGSFAGSSDGCTVK